MDQGQSYFGAGGGSGNVMPVSAFSAYSLLTNCNYLIRPQASDAEVKPTRSIQEELHRTQLSDVQALSMPDSHKTFLTKSFLSSTPLFSYSNPILLPNEQLGTCPNTVPPCPNLYSPSFRKQRSEKKAIPDNQKDDKYFERRRRNNQAAKKSRDARKMREDQVALRATILEHENAILRAQVITLREEASSLRQMLLQKKALEIASRDPRICIT